MTKKNNLGFKFILDIILFFFPAFPILFLFLVISIGGVGLLNYFIQFGPCYLLMIITELFIVKIEKPFQKFILLFISLTMIAFYLQFSLNAMGGGLSIGGNTDWISRYKLYAKNAFFESLSMSIFIVPYATFVIWLDRFGFKNLFKWITSKIMDKNQTILFNKKKQSEQVSGQSK